MSPETQKALEAFALDIISAAKSGAAWTSDQAPLLVQEWLKWQLAEATFSAVAGLVIAVLLFCLGRHFYKIFQADDDNPIIILGVLCWVGTCIALIRFGIHALIVIKVLVAPRVVVFEKFMEIIK